MIIQKAGRTAKSYVAIGNFDGVHIGHSELIDACIREAKEAKAESLVFSFEKNPINALNNKTVAKNIISNGEKARILEEKGIDILYLADFNAIRDLSPEDFCKKILIEELNAEKVFCGFNFTFGKNASGKASDLKRILAENGIELSILPEKKIDGKTVSSTLIRNFIKNGDMHSAARFLGRNFALRLDFQRNENGLSALIPEEYIAPESGAYDCFIKYDDIAKKCRCTVQAFAENEKTEIIIGCRDADIPEREMTVEFI